MSQFQSHRLLDSKPSSVNPLDVASTLSPQQRIECLREFIARKDFICPIGSTLERANAITYTILSTLTESESYIPQLMEGVERYIKQGSGAWIIQFPFEPSTRAALEVESRRICAHLLATVVMQEKWGQESQIIDQAVKEGVSADTLNIDKSDELTLIGPSQFFEFFPKYLLAKLKSANFTFETVLTQFAEELVKLIPNTYITPENGRSFQTIMMGPLFHQSQTLPSPVTQKYQINHGRFAPSSCLVVTYFDEVQKAKQSKLGEDAQRNTMLATLVYNEYATKQVGRYDPSDILSRQFLLDQNKAIDEFLMAKANSIVESNAPKVLERGLAQILGSLPAKIQELIKQNGGIKTLDDLKRMIDKLTRAKSGTEKQAKIP